MPATQIDRIDGLTTSVALKAPVRVVATSPITFNGSAPYGYQTIDGVAVSDNISTPDLFPDRVLLVGQTDHRQNGIWQVSSLAWTRALDFDGARDAVEGTMCYVNEGSNYANTTWKLTTANPVVFGTSLITFALVFIPLTGVLGGPVYWFGTTAQMLSGIPGGTILADGQIVQTAARTAEGDGGGAEFYYNASDSTTADNGGTVRVDSQGRRWFATTQNPTPLLFGAKGNAIAISDAAVTTNPLSSASHTFTAADIGKTIGVRGAGAAGATLITTIASISAGNAVLTAPASTTVTGAAACFGTDDAAALQSFIAALPAKVGYLGPYKYLCKQQLKFCQNDTVAAGLYGTPGTFDAYDASLWSTAILMLLASSSTDAITDDAGGGAFNPRPMTFRDVGFCMYGTGRDGIVVTEAKNPYWANVAVLYSGRDGVAFSPNTSFRFVEKGVYINVTPFNNGRHGFSFTTSVDGNYISEMSFYGCEVRGVGAGGAPIFGSTVGGTFAAGTQIADITWISFAPNLEDASEVSALCGIRLVAVSGKSNSFGRWKFFNCGMENTHTHVSPIPWINEDATIQGDGWFVEPAAFASNYTPYSNGYIGLTIHPAYDGVATFSGQSDTNSGNQVIKSLAQSNGNATLEASVPGSGSAILLLDLATGQGVIKYQRGGVMKAQMVFNQSGQAFIDYETSLALRFGVNGTAALALGNAQVSFFNGILASKQAVSGALSTVTDTNAKAVLTSILSALSAYGLITNSTT